MQAAMEDLRAELRKQGLPEIHMRVGVNTCTAIVGNMGSESRFAYTAMGDGINLASRLEGSNKFWKTKIIASGETVAKLGGRVSMRRVDRVRVSGKTEPVDVFTPCADAAVVERTTVAFEAYLRRDWGLAADLYGKLLQENPDDGVAMRLLERIEEWRAHPEAASEDGSLALDKL
jgi:adenylate cyclase